MQHTKWRYYLLTALFTISMLALGWLAFADKILLVQHAQDTSHSERFVEYSTIKLGTVKPADFKSFGFTKGLTKVSADGRHVVVGSQNGDLICINTDGRIQWRIQLGLAEITQAGFVFADRYLLVGEKSPTGTVRLLNTSDGRTSWEYNLAQDLGSNINTQEYPTLVSLSSNTDRIILAAQRQHADSERKIHHISRIYALTSAAELHRYPPDHNMDTALSAVSIADNGTVVWGTNNWKVAQELQYQDTLYMINQQFREVVAVNIAAKAPYQNTTLRDNPVISADGNYIAVLTGDGRGLLLDAQGRELWQVNLSQPQLFNGIYINAIGLQSKIVRDKVIFILGNTHERSNWRLPTPIEDPNANTVFVFTLRGELLLKKQLGSIGAIEQISANEQMIALAVGRNVKTKATNAHGVYLLDLADSERIEYLPTVGPCIALDISNDYRIAAVEAPLQLDNGRIIGSYKLHMYRLREQWRINK